MPFATTIGLFLAVSGTIWGKQFFALSLHKQLSLSPMPSVVLVGLREEALFPDQEWHYLIFFNLFFWFPITYDKNLTGGQLFVICN